jgi:hypothetical protein
MECRNTEAIHIACSVKESSAIKKLLTGKTA